MNKRIVLLMTLFPTLTLAQRATFDGIGVPPGADATAAVGVSADGRTVIGEIEGPGDRLAARWTRSGGLQPLAPPPGESGNWAPRGVSGDGAVIVVQQGSAERAYRWTEATGMVDLGTLPGGSGAVSAGGVSEDGGVIVGGARVGLTFAAYRWTEAGGMSPLLPGDPVESAAVAISGDGATVVVLRGEESFRWTSAGGLQPLGLDADSFVAASSRDGAVLVGTRQPSHEYFAFRWTETGARFFASSFSMANAVTADGEVVAGIDDFHIRLGDAYLWDEARGMRLVRDLLVNEYGLDLTGWTLWSVTGVSADGQVVVGRGENPAGAFEGWVARLGDGPCYADCDASGGLDFFDFLCFQDAFGAAERYGDCDGSGALDFFDFLCFQNEFAAGCP
ncbi:MAG: PEP-CTERM sorting domain-containing protein [Phycisphaerales bacterium JB039]